MYARSLIYAFLCLLLALALGGNAVAAQCVQYRIAEVYATEPYNDWVSRFEEACEKGVAYANRNGGSYGQLWAALTCEPATNSYSIRLGSFTNTDAVK